MDQNCSDMIYSEEYFNLIIEINRYSDLNQLFPNSCIIEASTTHTIVYTPVSTLPRNVLQVYGYGAIPNCYTLLDNASLEASGVTRVQNIPALNLRGQGVLIGIVDTGIDYLNNAFRYEDGTTKIISIWDQTIRSENAMPRDLYYGTEYTQEQINQALQNENPLSVVPTMDENGHGTMLSGIIVGSANQENNFSGIVPDANLVVVKLKPAKANIKDFFVIPSDSVCYQEDDIMLALKYFGYVSQELGRPMAICIGLGTSQGGHDGRNPLSTLVNRAADYPGSAFAIAAGNEGRRRLHYFGTIEPRVRDDTLELNVGEGEYGFSMELWGTTPSSFSFDLTSPSGEYIPRIPARLGATGEIRFIFEPTVISYDYQLIEAETGDELILFRFRSPSPGIWRFRIYAAGTQISYFHIWLPIHDFLRGNTFFTEADPDTTITGPGNTSVPMVVTAYDTSNQSIYIEASRGFTRSNMLVPSFAAPGVNMITPGLNNEFATVTGTCAAAAHVTGLAAIILEWGIVRGNNIFMDSQNIKNLLIRGTREVPFLTYPNREWGYGMVDLYNTFITLRGTS